MVRAFSLFQSRTNGLLIPADRTYLPQRYYWIFQNSRETAREAGTHKRRTDTLVQLAGPSSTCKGHSFVQHIQQNLTPSQSRTWQSTSTRFHCKVPLQPEIANTLTRSLGHGRPATVPGPADPSVPYSARQTSETGRTTYRNPGFQSQRETSTNQGGIESRLLHVQIGQEENMDFSLARRLLRITGRRLPALRLLRHRHAEAVRIRRHMPALRQA